MDALTEILCRAVNGLDPFMVLDASKDLPKLNMLCLVSCKDVTREREISPFYGIRLYVRGIPMVIAIDSWMTV